MICCTNEVDAILLLDGERMFLEEGWKVTQRHTPSTLVTVRNSAAVNVGKFPKKNVLLCSSSSFPPLRRNSL